MLVKCDKCQAMYMVDDSQVEQKKGKIACTNCQNIITVEGYEEGSAPTTAPPEPTAPVEPPVVEKEEEPSLALSPQVEKYMEMLREDPKSKVFVRLADEYIKGGLYDEAIHVCEEGLEHNPNYLSGKVPLGRG